MATKQLTNEQITLLLKLNYVPDSLTEEETVTAKNIAMHRTNVGEVVKLITRLLEPNQKQVNGVDRGIDVIERLLRNKLKLTDKDFEKAEKEVDEINEQEREKLVKSYREALDKMRTETIEKGASK